MRSQRESTELEKTSRFPGLGFAAILVSTALAIAVYKGNRSSDTVGFSKDNPGQSYRATLLRRRSWSRGNANVGATTLFVLLNKENARRPSSDSPGSWATVVVMKAPVSFDVILYWEDDKTLKIICQHCNVAYSELNRHLTRVGSVKVMYEGFKPR